MESKLSTRILLLVVIALCVWSNLGIASDDVEVLQAEVTVGIDQGDFRGSDGRVLQAAVDYVGNLGGGTVRIGAGTFIMRDSLKLQDNTRVIGVPGKTILVSCDAHQSKLVSTGGINERQVTVEDPSGFRIGDGVMVQDDESMYGFYVTQATITARLDRNTFRISRPLYHDYSPSRNGRVTSGFPVIGLWGAKNVRIEGLTIDGNSESMKYLTGCRGGGMFMFECDNVHIRNCTVRNYNGDAISFQDSTRVLIEDSICESNKGVGLHPGCGTEGATVRRTKCMKNGGDGLFLCLRVKHCVFENNDFSDNRRHGISIGLKDSDNLFRGNVITSNAKTGIWFREHSAPEGAHRNVFENNRIIDNGICVKIEGEHHELVFRENQMGNTKPTTEPQSAIVSGSGAKKLTMSNNQFINVKSK